MLQWHGLLYRFTAGEGGRWKSHDNSTIERHPDGAVRVRFQPVPAVATPQAMSDLVGLYRAATEEGQEPLHTVPLAVLDFLCIHPFRDGNGRVSRLLTLLLLHHHGYEVGRSISLEHVFEQSKDSYYRTLEASSRGWHEGQHDALPWLRYFWGVLLAAYKELEQRVGRVANGAGAKGERVRSAVLRRALPFAISELENDCPDVSREHIRKVLTRLRDEGVVRMEGAGRGARWHRND